MKLLISGYSELKPLLGKGKHTHTHTKKEVFAKIETLMKKAEHMVTGDQCLCKWNKLESKVEDHNKKTGNYEIL